jgi:hypothetical protein
MYQVVKFDQPYSKVFENLPEDKNQLFIKANEWMIKTFNNAESVIQYSDKEAGALIGKYLMSGSSDPGYPNRDTRIYAKIDIRVKDNKAIIIIEPLSEWKHDPSGLTILTYSKEDAITDMDALSESFHKSLIAKAIEF